MNSLWLDDDSEPPESCATDWSTVPDGGFAQFQEARRLHLEKLRRESEIFRLEQAWAASPGG